ncbi:hypothetical protein GCM10022225_60120 [Plantactinospora mayteni]|uniref:Uncharacterized protein n=1 Tax=Plantactinospora mayteni TaxID=566021 RepID=A0ABQ4EK61_9ACTN|nr:hypothetical protein [Plantactinospora mayteni]GIG95137.1 hypothetical protein Pma05_17100 [Plantactinospora mayteni]
MSQPEENREKSAKTDAVLRPPVATPGPAKPRPPQGRRNRTEEEPARPEAPAAEEA